MASRAPFEIGSYRIEPGSRWTVDLPIGVLSDHTPGTMLVHVVHGRRDGSTLFVSAAVHGDEVIGVEIPRRFLRSRKLDSLQVTLVVVPMVSAFGFLNHSRYLPDRRDLNRSFPGSDSGSLAGRVADMFMKEIVSRSDSGIDIHSAAIHRTNLPRIRISPASDKVSELADVFGASVAILSREHDGSLRKVAGDRGVDIILYEAGEGLRFDELSARVGVAGILRVMQAMGMSTSRGIFDVQSIRSDLRPAGFRGSSSLPLKQRASRRTHGM